MRAYHMGFKKLNEERTLGAGWLGGQRWWICVLGDRAHHRGRARISEGGDGAQVRRDRAEDGEDVLGRAVFP